MNIQYLHPNGDAVAFSLPNHRSPVRAHHMLQLRRSIADLPTLLRPLQSLLLEAVSSSGQPCSVDASCSYGGHQPPHRTSTRSFNARAAAASFYKNVTEVFNIPTLMHPDVYNPVEKAAAQKFKFHGKLMHPYYKPRPLASWNLYANGNEGWDELGRRLAYFYNRVYAHRVCRQSLWGFSGQALRQHAIELYQEINAALAEGHKGRPALEPIKDLVTPVLFNQMLGEASRLQQSGKSVQWKMVKPLSLADVKLVNGSVARAVNNPNQQVNVKLHFVQWTVEITSEQTFAVYERPTGTSAHKGQASASRLGSLVAGDPNTPIKVVDYWVFERPVFKSMFMPKPGPRGATWRLAARLKQPEGIPPPLPSEPV